MHMLHMPLTALAARMGCSCLSGSTFQRLSKNSSSSVRMRLLAMARLVSLCLRLWIQLVSVLRCTPSCIQCCEYAWSARRHGSRAFSPRKPFRQAGGRGLLPCALAAGNAPAHDAAIAALTLPHAAISAPGHPEACALISLTLTQLLLQPGPSHACLAMLPNCSGMLTQCPCSVVLPSLCRAPCAAMS